MVQILAGQRLLVGALAAFTTVGYGALYYTQPLLAVAAEQAHGWTRVQTSLAFTLALLVTAMLAPRVGQVLDRHGGRWLLTAGALIGGLAFVLLASSTSYVLFIVGWLLIGVAMTLMFYEAAFTVLAQQVGAAARTQATLTITLVAGLASTIFVPLSTALLEGAGLDGTLLALAALLFLVGGLAGWALRPLIPHSREGARTMPFVLDAPFRYLGVAFTLARIVTVGVGLQLAPMLLAADYAPGLAAGLTGLMGLAALPGRVLFVPLLARLGVVTLTAALFF